MYTTHATIASHKEQQEKKIVEQLQLYFQNETLRTVDPICETICFYWMPSVRQRQRIVHTRTHKNVKLRIEVSCALIASRMCATESERWRHHIPVKSLHVESNQPRSILRAVVQMQDANIVHAFEEISFISISPAHGQ